jgi:hypothetical protein
MGGVAIVASPALGHGLASHVWASVRGLLVAAAALCIQGPEVAREQESTLQCVGLLGSGSRRDYVGARQTVQDNSMLGGWQGRRLLLSECGLVSNGVRSDVYHCHVRARSRRWGRLLPRFLQGWLGPLRNLGSTVRSSLQA